MVRPSQRSWRPACLTALAISCATAAPPTIVTAPQPTPTATDTPPAQASEEDESDESAATLAALEEQLMGLDFAVRFDVEAQGAVESRLVGELRLQGDHVALSASGSFGGRPVELSLRGDGTNLRGSNGTATLDLPQPIALKEALVIGWTRMGLLHNLAMLVSVRAPDHADGGVRDWVRAQSASAVVRVGPDTLAIDAVADPQPISFTMLVAASPSGDATLWRDAGSNLPVERHVIVRFPDGEMRVHERYTIEVLGPAS